MRGCLLLIAGVVIGAGLMFLARPHEPSGYVAPQGGDVRVSISDAYLARRIGQETAGNNVRNVKVRSLPPSTLVVDLDLEAGPLSVPAEMQVQPVVAAGYVHIRILSLQLAGIPLPGQIGDLIAGIINRSTGNLLGSQAEVIGVRVAPQGLVIVADYRS